MQSVLDQVRVILYRYHERGLEVFLIEPELDKDPTAWKIPVSKAKHLDLTHESLTQGLNLDMACGDGCQTYAIEADWHDIPSIRGIIKSDVNRIKNKIKQVSEKGTYVSVKDALKKVMPDEYAALKELKDILKERNLLMNIWFCIPDLSIVIVSVPLWDVSHYLDLHRFQSSIFAS